MARNIFFTLVLSLTLSSVCGQDDSAYLKSHAVHIVNPDNLNDAVYKLLSPFQIIMAGEMHGTNESAQFVTALANLLTAKGDSVSVGLEIPSAQMTRFISQRTDSSIYRSEFFLHPAFETGKESVAWTGLIAKLKDNRKVELFFYDATDNEAKLYSRDSIMYANVKSQFKKHPEWKIVTISGNYHNKLPNKTSMTSFLKRDKELNLSAKICSLNLEYLEGTCRADFGNGLEEKKIKHLPRVYDTATTFDKYVVLVSPQSSYDYTGFYYAKKITAAKMTRHEK